MRKEPVAATAAASSRGARPAATASKAPAPARAPAPTISPMTALVMCCILHPHYGALLRRLLVCNYRLHQP